ncbi:dTMP kinase [bacterium]|nr:dTMP kinase [bacterium]
MIEFPKNFYPGKFIVFEGLDGSGQTTQATLLKDFLEKEGKKVLLTKEPTKNSPFAKKIEKILEKKEKISPFKLQKLFALDRAWHLEKEIIPALKKGKIVISDRYFFSSFAYGASEGLSLKNLIKLNQKFLLPDLTLILKVSPKKCIQRIKKRGEKITLFEKEKKLKKVWGFYQKFPKMFEKVKLIDGEEEIKKVFQKVKKEVKKIISL